MTKENMFREVKAMIYGYEVELETLEHMRSEEFASHAIDLYARGRLDGEIFEIKYILASLRKLVK